MKSTWTAQPNAPTRKRFLVVVVVAIAIFGIAGAVYYATNRNVTKSVTVYVPNYSVSYTGDSQYVADALATLRNQESAAWGQVVANITDACQSVDTVTVHFHWPNGFVRDVPFDCGRWNTALTSPTTTTAYSGPCIESASYSCGTTTTT